MTSKSAPPALRPPPRLDQHLQCCCHQRPSSQRDPGRQPAVCDRLPCVPANHTSAQRGTRQHTTAQRKTCHHESKTNAWLKATQCSQPVSASTPSCSPPTHLHLPSKKRPALSTVFLSSMAMAITPTPPGTLMAPATWTNACRGGCQVEQAGKATRWPQGVMFHTVCVHLGHKLYSRPSPI